MLTKPVLPVFLLFFLPFLLIALQSTPLKKNTAPIATDVKKEVKGVTDKKQIQVGLWTEGFWDDTTKRVNLSTLSKVEQKLDKKMAIAHFYTGWELLTDARLLDAFTTIHRYGARPMVSMNPYYFPDCPWQNRSIYEAIASGSCDTFLHAAGKSLATVTYPVFFRFAWEANVPSMEWSLEQTQTSGITYKSAWQRMHDILQNEGANQVLWVFAMNTITPTSTPYAFLYPGDSYVDWLGLDGYNWGTTQSWSRWQSFSEVFEESYQDITRLTNLKPIMLSEVNTTDEGGDKAAWYTTMLSEIPRQYPRIQAVVLYNEDRTKTEHVNWLIDINLRSLAALKSGLKDRHYSSSSSLKLD